MHSALPPSNLFSNGASTDRHRAPATSTAYEPADRFYVPPRTTQYLPHSHSPPTEVRFAGSGSQHYQPQQTFQSTQQQQHYAHDREVLSRADLSPEKDLGTFARSAASSGQFRGADEYVQSRLQQQQHSTPAKSSGSWGETPGTGSRASVSRINKLGNDLQALASKLDSFDSSASKHKY